MDKRLLSRVLMMPDGSLHAALADKHTLVCSPKVLEDLLKDPVGFATQKQFNPEYSDSTNLINPKQKQSLENIQGITLIKLYRDGEVVCQFPKLFEVLFAMIKNSSKDPINLLTYMNDDSSFDEKHLLLKFYSEFANCNLKDVKFEHCYDANMDLNKEIVGEMLNTYLIKLQRKEAGPTSVAHNKNNKYEYVYQPVIESTSNETSTSLEPSAPKVLTPDNTISSKEYAEKHDVDPGTVSGWCKGEKVNYIVYKGDYRIDPTCPRPATRKAGRKPKVNKNALGEYIKKHGKNSYKAVQEYISDKKVLSPESMEYLRNFDELFFYIENNYFEVIWNGRPCFIIDIKPSYFSHKHQKTNREIILEGKYSPVVPNTPGNTSPETDVFAVHHVGQKVTSPFAIVKESLHKKYDKYFHYPATSDWNPDKDEDLHGSNFEFLKKEFWKKYLTEYDSYKTFNAIKKHKISPL